jgi:hypothetical protein
MAHFQRLGLSLEAPRYPFLTTNELLRGWLACTELAGLDVVRDTILNAGNRDDAAAMLEVFCLVQAPEAAVHMLQLRHESKAAHLARKWLDEHVEIAIAGLVSVAAGRGTLAEEAVAFLRDAERAGHGRLIEKQVRLAPHEIGERVRKLVLDHDEKVYPPLDEIAGPAWLQEALASNWQAKEKSLPTWLHVQSLPPLVMGKHRLSDAVVRRMLSGWKQSTLRKWPLVEGVQKHVDVAFRDAFAWKLFEMWLAEGGPSKDRWAMLAVGYLGGDQCALKLAPLIRAWPGEMQSKRAELGLECLQRIGTDAALIQLGHIARKVKSQALRKKARTMMDRIASDRGLSREELEDRIVPDLGFDERGRRDFECGSHRFEIVLDENLMPRLRDESGKLKDDPPAAGRAEWTALKKQLREVLKTQATRLEQSLVGRRWSMVEFEAQLLHHPLMLNLARRLLWLGHDAAGKRVLSFRINEEGKAANQEDRACSLADIATVGLAHPLLLTPDERIVWGNLFSDYLIVPPFPQLGRLVFTLRRDEESATRLERWSGRKYASESLLFGLEGRGWIRGDSSEGIVTSHTRQFTEANITAQVKYRPGISIINRGESDEQEIDGVYFVGGAEPRVLRDVSAVVISEVIADLDGLTSKEAL